MTPEQIRLLEELRELRDAEILTVDEFELQVAKVLGRPLVVEPAPVDEELLAPTEMDGAVAADISGEAIHEDHTVSDDVALAPETTLESELVEYEFVEPATSDEDEILAEENRVVEPLSNFDSPASAVVESETQQNKSSRRKVLIGTTAGLILIVVIALVTLGGGKSDSTSSQIINSTTTVTENASTERTDAPTSLGNVQTPETSSQSGAITTTVPQNTSTGTAKQPPLVTSPITTPVATTVANPDSRLPIVTSLKVSKSQPVFYNYPYPVAQTATFTASIVNDEGAQPLLLVKGPPGYSFNFGFDRVRPGTWEANLSFFWADGRTTALVGLYEFCVALSNAVRQCTGPSVSFEVLEQEPSVSTISDGTISPTVVYAGDTFRVTARVVNATGVSRVFGSVFGDVRANNCDNDDLSLISGDLRDGLWSFECTLTGQVGQGRVQINAEHFVAEKGWYSANFVYPITVLEPVLNGLESARNS